MKDFFIWGAKNVPDEILSNICIQQEKGINA